MKSKKIFTAIAVSALLTALGSNAFADDKYVGELGSNWQDHITSTKSRAQVVAELEQARANGMAVGAGPFYPDTVVTPSVPRAQVVAELKQARADGMAVGAGPFYPDTVVTPSVRSRAEANQAAQKTSRDPGDIYFGS